MPELTSALPHEQVMPALTDPEWLACFQHVCRLLWPAPAVVALAGASAGPAGAPGSQEFALIPGLHRPPIMAPADRHALATVVRYRSGTKSLPIRLAARSLSVGLAAGLGGALLRGRIRVSVPPGADTIETYLSSVMSRDIRVSMQLGRPRANRKPVLQMIDASGASAGFVKVGINPLTSSLVRAERDSLERLSRAGLTEVSVPRVLHYGTWHDLDVLVLSALPTWRSHRLLSGHRLTAAMTEVATVNGLRREQLARSEYYRLLRARLAAACEGPERDTICEALDTLAALAGDTVLTLGSWHGDWAPWNMASTGRGLLVWDWERFTGNAPVGFDALHYWLQAEAAKNEPRLAASRCLDRAPRLLAPMGVRARQAQVTAILYLADLATRYIADKQAEAGAQLGATGTWLIPVIAGGVARLRDNQAAAIVLRASSGDGLCPTMRPHADRHQGNNADRSRPRLRPRRLGRVVVSRLGP
jgi:hypothetical protein